MKQKYIYTDKYESESKRISAYKRALINEKPIAKLINRGQINWRYYADTTIGTIFFELPVKTIINFNYLNEIAPAYLLNNWIKI